jgi:hypothetical protein
LKAWFKDGYRSSSDEADVSERLLCAGEFNWSSQHLLEPIGRRFEVQDFSGSAVAVSSVF